MQKKIFAHVLLLPYNTLCFLIGVVIFIFGGLTRNYSAENFGKSIADNRKSTGTFVSIQILVFAISLGSAKFAIIAIGICFVCISVLGRYLLSKSRSSFYQSMSRSDSQLDYQSNSDSFQQHQNQYQQNQYQQSLSDDERQRQDAERDRQRREQQEYYERQQRESQQRQDEQMRRDEEFRQRQRDEERRRDEENRKNWGRF